MQDQYPGDTQFTAIVHSIYQGGLSKPGGKSRPPNSGVAFDQIILENKSQVFTRPDIVDLLLTRYAADVTLTDGTVINCKDFLWNTNFTQSACLNSLYYTDGYNNLADWNSWAGLHDGHWYRDRGDQFDDRAFWAPSRLEGQHNGGTAYKFQDATFLESNNSVKRRGWNQAHEDVMYVWGWDPKEQGNANGWIGAHLGFRHEESGASCLFWFTPEDVFFEAVKEQGGQRRRISVGYGPSDDQYAGRGLWTIDANVTTQPSQMRIAPSSHTRLQPIHQMTAARKLPRIKSVFRNPIRSKLFKRRK